MYIPRGKLLALIAFVFAASMVTATGAFSSVEADRAATVEVTGDADAYLGLEPAEDSPNADYAELDDDETLALRLDGDNDAVAGGGDGVNKDAVTTMDNVFHVTNQGTQDVTVQIDHEVDEVTFYDGDGDAIDSGDGVELGPGDHVEVGIEVDTEDHVEDGDLFGDEEITVIADSDETDRDVGGGGDE